MSELLWRCALTLIGGFLIGSALASAWIRWRRWMRRPKFTEFVRLWPWQRYWTQAELVEFLRASGGVEAAFLTSSGQLLLVAEKHGAISVPTLQGIANRIPAYVQVSVHLRGDSDPAVLFPEHTRIL